MRILLFGCGWLGKQVVNKLLDENHFVLALTKSSIPEIHHPNFKHSNFDVEAGSFNNIDFASFDEILLFLNPQQLNSNFLDTIKTFKKVIIMSSISIYGDQGIVDENTLPEPITENGKRLSQIENQYPYFTFLRLGGLVGPSRGPSRFLRPKENILLKNEVINLVHSTDVVDSIAKLIQLESLPKKINLVTPFHPKKEAFYCNLIPNIKYQLETSKTGKQVNSIYEKELGIQYKNVNLLDLKLYDETSN